MRKLSRALVVALAGATAVALALSGISAASGGTLASPTFARPAASSLLENAVGRGRHPETIKEMTAAAGSHAMRAGTVEADVVAARLAAFRQAAAIRTASGAFGNAWKELGPTKYVVNDPNYGGGASGHDVNSGRVSTIAVDPSDPSASKVWIGTASGGVWYTSDAGAHWTPKFDGMPSLIIGAIAIDPKDPKTVYVGTGDNATGGFYVFPGTGLYVTRDGGATWSRPAKNLQDASTVYRIEIAGGRIFVASNKGLYVSTDGGRSFTDARLPSNTAHTAPSGSRLGSVVTDVRAKPGSPNELLAVVGWRKGKYGNPASEGNGLYTSTQGGLPGTWTFLESNLGYASPGGDKVGRTALAYDPSKPNVVWAAVQDPSKFAGEILDAVGDPLLGAVLNPFNGIYRSSDGGKTWELKGTTQTFQAAPGSGIAAPFPGLSLYTPGIQSWFNLYVEVDPTDSGNVIVGLEEIYQSTENADSDNGLASWKTIGRYWNACAFQLDAVDCSDISPVYEGKITTHPDQHAAVLVKTPGGVRLYAGNDGGMYRQDAAAGAGFSNANWQHLNDGLGTLQPYYAVMSKDGTVYAGMQDNGTVKIPPNSTVGYEVYGGDGGDVAVEPDNANNAWEEYTYASIRVTEDGGQTWTDVTPVFDGAQFIQAFEMDETNPDHVVLPGKQVLETTKGVKTRCNFDDNSVDTEAEAAVFKGGPTCDWMLTVDLGNLDPNAASTSGLDVLGKHVYIAYCGVCDVLTQADGDPTKFNNGIATNVKTGCEAETGSDSNGCWHKAAAAGLPKRYISDVAMDPSDVKTIYATLSGWSRKWYTPRKTDPGVGKGQVYVSHDGGEHFTDVTGNLPDIPANAVLVRGDRVYVGNDIGVYTSVKGSGVWERLGTGLPNGPASDLNLNPQGTKLVVAMFGRGVWTYDFGAAPSTSKPSGSSKPTKVLGKRTALPATGAEHTVALGLALLACAVLLARRYGRAG